MANKNTIRSRTCYYARAIAGTSWFARMHVNCDYALSKYYAPRKHYCEECPFYVVKEEDICKNQKDVIN